MDNPSTRIAQHMREPDDGYRVRRPDSEIDYFEQFVKFDSYMNRTIHPNVNTGAAAYGDGWLTDHGADHISTLIRRIDELTHIDGRCVLSPYEVYLLLVAAHVHDVGNMYGRMEHEQRAKTSVFTLPSMYIGSDNVEKRLIVDIAMAHGGLANDGGVRDTIGALHHGRDVKRLAAVLRFADELSDDNSRTNRFVIDAVGRIAPGSKAYHLYAERLRRPEICHDSSSIKLTFELLKDHLVGTYRKGARYVYVLDEIMERTLKTHREQIYCGKFMNPHIVSESIEVAVLICTGDYAEVVGTVSYVFDQIGYPEHLNSVVRLVPELASLSGRSAADRIDQIFDANQDFDAGRNLVPELSGGLD